MCELKCALTKPKYYPLQIVPASLFYILDTNKDSKWSHWRAELK